MIPGVHVLITMISLSHNPNPKGHQKGPQEGHHWPLAAAAAGGHLLLCQLPHRPAVGWSYSNYSFWILTIFNLIYLYLHFYVHFTILPTKWGTSCSFCSSCSSCSCCHSWSGLLESSPDMHPQDA